jgi:hypothetical protein
MKKSELRKLIKEELLKENTPGLESVKSAYEAKNLKESNLSLEEQEEIGAFIGMLEQAVQTARQIEDGEMERVPLPLRMDFGSLVDSLRDGLRGFE